MENSSYIKVIPTEFGPEETKNLLDRHQKWFYNFRFSNNITTENFDTMADIIHQVRSDLVFPWLDEMFKGRWGEINCVDIACHQGYFSTQLALRGARSVLGFDIREEHIEMAGVIKKLANLNNLSYRQQNIYEVGETTGQFELVLFLGLLYHLDNPMGALRKVKALTSNICVIETQVARPSGLQETLWGSDPNPRKGQGMGVFPIDLYHTEKGVNLLLIPSLNALYSMLYAVGFSRLYLGVPPPHFYSQYPDFDRVVIFAQV